MDEDDTFKRLKSLPLSEAKKIYNDVIKKYGMPISVTDVEEIRKILDPLLKPYDWSYARILGEDNEF